jgi:hypothetical protein
VEDAAGFSRAEPSASALSQESFDLRGRVLANRSGIVRGLPQIPCPALLKHTPVVLGLLQLNFSFWAERRPGTCQRTMSPGARIRLCATRAPSLSWRRAGIDACESALGAPKNGADTPLRALCQPAKPGKC